MKKVWAIIPARGGSKGLPNKNIRHLDGKPLIYHTLAPALACKEISRVIVSTDSPVIADVARSYGAEVPFLRPPHLSSDSSDVTKAIYWTVDKLVLTEGAPDELVVMFPTQPFKSSVDISKVIKLMDKHVQVSSAVPFEINMSRYSFTYAGKKYRLSSSDKRITVYKPTGAYIAMKYSPPGYRPFEDVLKWSKYIKDRYGDSVHLMSALFLLSSAKSMIDIDTIDDLINAEQILRGEEPKLNLGPQSLPFCTMGMKTLCPVVRERGSNFGFDIDLADGEKYIIHMRGVDWNGYPFGMGHFYDITLQEGKVIAEPLFNGSMAGFKASYMNGRFQINWTPEAPAHYTHLVIGASPDDNFCDFNKPFSLPPLWRYDVKSGQKINLLSGKRIFGRQDIPSIEEDVFYSQRTPV